MSEDFICDFCGKSVDSVYFYEDKEICEKCYMEQRRKDKKDSRNKLGSVGQRGKEIHKHKEAIQNGEVH